MNLVPRTDQEPGTKNQEPTQGRLDALLEMLDSLTDPADRASMLLSLAEEFREVPPEVAARPFGPTHRVPQCESDAYVWALRQPDGSLKLYFAVENPSGVSARALATLLDRALSGRPATEIAAVSPEIVERVFRQNISMGKGLGLMSMVLAVRALARQAVAEAGMDTRDPRTDG